MGYVLDPRQDIGTRDLWWSGRVAVACEPLLCRLGVSCQTGFTYRIEPTRFDPSLICSCPWINSSLRDKIHAISGYPGEPWMLLQPDRNRQYGALPTDHMHRRITENESTGALIFARVAYSRDGHNVTLISLFLLCVIWKECLLLRWWQIRFGAWDHRCRLCCSL